MQQYIPTYIHTYLILSTSHIRTYIHTYIHTCVFDTHHKEEIIILYEAIAIWHPINQLQSVGCAQMTLSKCLSAHVQAHPIQSHITPTPPYTTSLNYTQQHCMTVAQLAHLVCTNERMYTLDRGSLRCWDECSWHLSASDILFASQTPHQVCG